MYILQLVAAAPQAHQNMGRGQVMTSVLQSRSPSPAMRAIVLVVTASAPAWLTGHGQMMFLAVMV